MTANLVHRFYMSSADLEFCRDFDLAELESEPLFGELEALHRTLGELYPEGDDDEADAA